MMPPFGSCLRFGGISFLDAPLTGYTWPGSAGALAFWARLTNASFLQSDAAIACSGLEVDFLLSGLAAPTAVQGGSGPAAYQPVFKALTNSLAAPCAINCGEWHHYIVSYNGSTLVAAYIDGVLAAQATTSTGSLTASDLNVAATGFSPSATPPVPANTFPGDFCDVRVFASQITLSQALQLFGGGNGRDIALGGEVVWIPCNSLNVTDKSGNNFNGILYGQPEVMGS